MVKNIHFIKSDSFSSMIQHREEWDRFVEDSNGDIYMCFDWCRIWWEHYGKDKKLFLFIFFDGDKIVGIFPLFIHTVGIFPLRLRVARIIGTFYRCEPPIFPGYEQEVLKLLAEQLLDSNLCDTFVIGEFINRFNYIESISDLCSNNKRYKNKLSIRSKHPVIFIGLEGDYHSYLETVTSKERNNIRTAFNKIKKHRGELEISIAAPDNVEEFFNRFYEMHQTQWIQRGQAGHFHDWPDAYLFHLNLAKEMVKLSRLRLLKISTQGLAMTYEYSYQFGNYYHYYMRGNLTDEEFNKFSIGRVGLISALKDAIEFNKKEFDMGQGEYDYKMKNGGRVLTNHSLLFFRNSISKRIKILLWRFIGFSVHTVYYKIWVNRIETRINLRLRPFWQFWIDLTGFHS